MYNRDFQGICALGSKDSQFKVSIGALSECRSLHESDSALTDTLGMMLAKSLDQAQITGRPIDIAFFFQKIMPAVMCAKPGSLLYKAGADALLKVRD